ncbi:MAG TPA: hypothetical protein VG755_00820 [Nannocystaceae bacterium]|nr:hypothetical protein [Nannocystaceae bacterium]
MLLPLCVALAFASPAVAKRGNDAITRERGPVFSVAAAPRLGILVGDGTRLMNQQVGFGAGLQFRVHALRLGPLRIGGELHLGHTRFIDRRTIGLDSGGTARRYASLGHTDFALGPSFQLVMGPVFAELGVSAGLGISSFVRPTSAFPSEEQQLDATSAMIRGGGHFGVPIRNNSSIIFGAAVQKYFSRKKIVQNPDPLEPEKPADTNPFDMVVEVIVGYRYMF